MTQEHGEEFSPETSAGSGVAVLPPPPKIDLHDGHAIRRELGRVYRDMRGGVIPTQDGSRLAFVLNLLRQFYETSELQRRVEEIENIMDRGQDNGESDI